MDSHGFNSPISRAAGSLIRAAGVVCVCLMLLFSLAVAATASPDGRHASPAQARISLSFAVADFDGDLRPDLVAVQTGTGDVLRTDYWIQLQLSSAGLQNILVVAPAGGLHVVARDVNGDHTPDLVVTTTWLNQPVAIFLNDGHGVFSRIDPEAFPEAFGEAKNAWSSASAEMSEGDCVPQDSRQEAVSNSEVSGRAKPHGGLIAFSEARPGSDPLLISRPGRAPPRSFFLS